MTSTVSPTARPKAGSVARAEVSEHGALGAEVTRRRASRRHTRARSRGERARVPARCGCGARTGFAGRRFVPLSACAGRRAAPPRRHRPQPVPRGRHEDRAHRAPIHISGANVCLVSGTPCVRGGAENAQNANLDVAHVTRTLPLIGIGRPNGLVELRREEVEYR